MHLEILYCIYWLQDHDGHPIIMNGKNWEAIHRTHHAKSSAYMLWKYFFNQGNFDKICSLGSNSVQQNLHDKYLDGCPATVCVWLVCVMDQLIATAACMTECPASAATSSTSCGPLNLQPDGSTSISWLRGWEMSHDYPFLPFTFAVFSLHSFSVLPLSFSLSLL